MTRLEKMQSNNLSYRFGGVLDCIDNKNLSSEEVNVLMSLKEDERIIAGRKISSYARAALEILGLEKARGDVDAVSFIEDYA